MCILQSVHPPAVTPNGMATAQPTHPPGGNKNSQAMVTIPATQSVDMNSADVPAVYYGYDSNETVPADMCLIGCIFYMGEYLKADPCEDWIKVCLLCFFAELNFDLYH